MYMLSSLLYHLHSTVDHLHELFIVHLLIRDILPVAEQSVIRDRCRSALRLFPALNMDCLERYVVIFCSLLQDRHILGIEGALAGVVQDVSCLVYVWVFRAFFKLRLVCICAKRQIPQLYPVVRLVTDSKSLVFEELGIRKERFLLRRGKYAQPFTPLV